MAKLQTAVRFALKVLVALIIINFVFDVLGSAGLTVRSYVNNPWTAFKALTGFGNSTSTTTGQ